MIAPVRHPLTKDLGDFPTPPGLVSLVLGALGATGDRFPRVLEPTCGRGHFLDGLIHQNVPPREAHGIEIQRDHADSARLLIESTDVRLTIQTADLFLMDLTRDLGWSTAGPLLVVGNPPWVTTAAIGASGGSNGPKRSNARNRRGIDAMTGESNFDISEAIWLKLIRELAHESPTIALLCKTAVARNLLLAISREDLPVTAATIWKIDASRWFRASVDACLFRVEVGPGPQVEEIPVYPDLSADYPTARFGLGPLGLVADVDAYCRSSFADGVCPMTWRQGVKHDAASIMELDAEGRNKLGEIVDIESSYVYPLFKGGDLNLGFGTSHRSVILTQRSLGDDPSALEFKAPKLWSYLNRHRDHFDRRKSSIYRGRPPFALFGIGDYSFKPFKVAVSGLHKTPRFRVLEPESGRPAMVDDTSYFLPCDSREQAEAVASILNGPVALDLIRGLTFPGAKRPITKAVLKRVDLDAIRRSQEIR